MVWAGCPRPVGAARDFRDFQEIYWNYGESYKFTDFCDFMRKINIPNRNRASGPFRIVDIPKELLVFVLLGRRRRGKPLNFNNMP